MKQLFVVFAALVSVNAFAVPTPGTHVIASVTTGGGFVPPSMRFNHGIRVYSNGKVVSFKGLEEKKVTQLSPRSLTKLQSQISDVRETELIDLDEGKPRCMDAPSTTYEIRKSQASPALEIAVHASCHQMVLKNEEGRGIRATLERLLALAVR